MVYWSIGLTAAALALGATTTVEKVPAPTTHQGDDQLHVELVDLSPRFLAFYEAARDTSDPEARFALWKTHYGVAAVPPGPRGEAMARGLLDSGWSQYPAVLPVIRNGAAGLDPQPINVLTAVAKILEADMPIDVKVVAYVGAFDGNAYAVGDKGRPVVNIPVEMDPADRALVFPHEMTHAVHMKLAGLSGGWERSIAATMMQEGLAMHVAREVTPGHPDAAYVEYSPGWWASVQPRKAEILKGVVPALSAKDGETVFRFTMGTGPTGMQREAYAAGWFVIDHLRGKGMTLAQIARIAEAEMPATVQRAIEEMLAP